MRLKFARNYIKWKCILKLEWIGLSAHSHSMNVIHGNVFNAFKVHAMSRGEHIAQKSSWKWEC